MKSKAMNNYSITGKVNAARLDREQRKAAKAFRDSRRNARGRIYEPVKEAI